MLLQDTSIVHIMYTVVALCNRSMHLIHCVAIGYGGIIILSVLSYCIVVFKL